MQSSKGGLHVGADADLILLDDELNVQATYVGGVRAWSAQEGMLEEEEMVTSTTSPPRESSNTSEPPPHTLGSGSRPAAGESEQAEEVSRS